VVDGDRRACDLVLGGGGVRGVAHIGALTALEEGGYDIERAAGASAGAIAGAFAVAGVGASQLRDLFDDLDLTRFALSGVVERFRDNRALHRLIERFSADGTDPLGWITEVLDAQGVETFGDLRVANVGDDAVRIGNRDTGAQALLIDGGLTSGFPVNVLDRPDGPPRWPTFGIRLLPRPPAEAALPDSTTAFARMVVDALQDSGDQLAPGTDCDERRTVRVDLSDVSTLDLDIDGDQELAVFEDGYDAMRTFLDGFDFENYLSACR
jgi:NTE family protein